MVVLVFPDANDGDGDMENGRDEAVCIPFETWVISEAIDSMRFDVARALVHGSVSAGTILSPLHAADPQFTWLGIFWSEYKLLRLFRKTRARLFELWQHDDDDDVVDPQVKRVLAEFAEKHTALGPQLDAFSSEQLATALRRDAENWSILVGVGTDFGEKLEFVLNELRPAMPEAAFAPEVLFPRQCIWCGTPEATSAWILAQTLLRKKFAQFMAALAGRHSRRFVVDEFADFLAA